MTYLHVLVVKFPGWKIILGFKRNQFSFQVARVYPVIFPVYQIISLHKNPWVNFPYMFLIYHLVI